GGGSGCGRGRPGRDHRTTRRRQVQPVGDHGQRTAPDQRRSAVAGGGSLAAVVPGTATPALTYRPGPSGATPATAPEGSHRGTGWAARSVGSGPQHGKPAASAGHSRRPGGTCPIGSG